MHYLTFNTPERKCYEEVRGDTIEKLDAAMDTSRSSNFLNALQWINRLRLICNHGVSVNEPVNEAVIDEYIWCGATAQSVFDNLIDGGLAFYSRCGIDLSIKPLEPTQLNECTNDDTRISKTLEILCISCFTEVFGSRYLEYKYAKHVEPILDGVQRRFKYLHKKWWHCLQIYQIVSRKKKVLSSREEQARDRIHRLGQTKEVTTVRYIIKDSFEEVNSIATRTCGLADMNQNIIALQRKKKDLAELALFRGPSVEAQVDQSRLQYLRSLLE